MTRPNLAHHPLILYTLHSPFLCFLFCIYISNFTYQLLMTRRGPKRLNDTLSPSSPKRYKHHNIFTRCKINGTIQYLTAIDLSFDSVTIANFHRSDDEQFFKTSVYRILHDFDRTRHNDLSKSIETRHSSYKLIDA